MFLICLIGLYQKKLEQIKYFLQNLKSRNENHNKQGNHQQEKLVEEEKEAEGVEEGEPQAQTQAEPEEEVWQRILNVEVVQVQVFDC